MKNATDIKKLELLTYLTNEIRNPMTSIAASLHKLGKNSYDEDTGKELQSMWQNTENVLFLLDKTLNVDKIDEDGSTMRFREINLVKYLYNLLSVFRYQTTLGDIELAFHSSKDRVAAWIDRSKFDEVLMTLIGSAIKATPPGGKVDVEVSSNDKFASIAIRITGKSIETERISQLFELFQRSDSGSITGTNLDYYFCKEVVGLHKGKITATNYAEPEGCSITIQLPLGNAHIPQDRLTSRDNLLNEAWSSIDTQDNAEDGKGTVSGRKYSIIVIDEYPDICRYLQTLLSPRFNVFTYTNPTDGFNAAITDVPDLVIAEVMMAEIDGISIVKKLKGNANTSHVPVLLLTALPGEEVRLQGLLTGADAIISKPFNEEELILNCNNLIMSRSRLESHIKEKQIEKDMLHPIELESNNDLLMHKVLEIINERISDPSLNVEILANAIGISRGHLHRKIKEITGTSPGEYIRTIRLNQAAQLLKGDKKNISQIAYSVGYSNPSVFSTAFKSFFGISAKDYQKRHANTAGKESDKTI